jgi:hypothetical protein
MRAVQRVLWLGGWGILPEAGQSWVERLLPACRHRWIMPSAGWLASWQCACTEFEPDALAGYSLGTYLLNSSLAEQALADLGARIWLFAPFKAFLFEAGQGGRVRAAQLKFLQRQLKGDPIRALAGFYHDAGLPQQLTPESVSDSALVALQWGLEQLLLGACVKPYPGAQAWIGGEDVLLDAATISAQWPGCQLVQGAGHSLEAILQAAL